ncbi:MAG TPA: copper resistance protein NlpE N-terminal domain-containing protein [Pseudacidobacterium sp.]|nr:copper resistance protein NlpE N-terminal domain-containing protein [Pseudacidobacterium sp.]
MAPSEPIATLHTSQNSLDWAGVYEGVLPCADCPGIRIRLTLNPDGTFERVMQYLDRQVPAETAKGRFTWQASGNAITLDEHADGQQYSVGEGRLSLLYRDNRRASTVPNAVLKQTAVKSSFPQTLERYRWTLESATNSQGRRIDLLPPSQDHPVVFSFSGNRLSIQGQCNRMIGAYQVNAAGQFTMQGGPASTMIGCDPALMNADKALSGILAKPLQVKIENGQSPRLRLRSAANDTLTFTGEATPEALYGPGTIIFLEVAPHPVSCDHPPAPETRCLQIRERHYDEHGVAVGTPGAWRPLYENIEGFTHKEGVRNVLRVKRFNRNQAGASSTLYVLDLVVESEMVNP